VFLCYLVFKDQAAVPSVADFAIYTISFPLSITFFCPEAFSRQPLPSRQKELRLYQTNFVRSRRKNIKFN